VGEAENDRGRRIESTISGNRNLYSFLSSTKLSSSSIAEPSGAMHPDAGRNPAVDGGPEFGQSRAGFHRPSRRFVVVALVLGVLLIVVVAYTFATAVGQVPASRLASKGPNWKHLTPSKSPSPRVPMMTYDSKDGYVLLFGGYCNTPPPAYMDCNDTWEYAHGKWTQLHPKTAPSPRESGAMAYDARDG
jgi:hypothetical protein